MLRSTTGTGKTRAAYLLLHRLHFQEGQLVVALHGNIFAHDCAQQFGNQTGEAWIENLCCSDAIFLDDLAKFKLTERVEAELFGPIETCLANRLPVFVTTNHVGKTLEAKLTDGRGAPLVRRLRGFCAAAVAFWR